MSCSILNAAWRARAAALATPLVAASALAAGLAATPALAQQSDDAALCLDLTQAPRVVGDACQNIATDANAPIDARTAAAFRAGGAYQRIEAYREAEAAYTLAIELDPNFTDAFAGRAVVREELDNDAGAEADHNAAITMRPDDTVLLYNRGVFYFRSDREGEARADFYRVNELDPTAAWPFVYLGAMDDLAGNDDLGLLSYERAFQLDESILYQFQRSMESQGFDAGLPGEYSPEMRDGLLACMAVDCIIGVNE